MAARDRIRKYRESGGAADLVRVEVLVPRSKRGEIIAAAADLREKHRLEKDRLQAFIRDATEAYGLRIADNIDLSKLDDLRGKAHLVAKALMERGDARAYAMGRRIAAELEVAG
jgi:hypothetical protein